MVPSAAEYSRTRGAPDRRAPSARKYPDATSSVTTNTTTTTSTAGRGDLPPYCTRSAPRTAQPRHAAAPGQRGTPRPPPPPGPGTDGGGRNRGADHAVQG